MLGLPAPANAQSTVTPSASSSGAASAPATKTRHTRRARTFDIEQYITNLHKQLKITPDQETQWKQVADVMRQNSAAMQSATQEYAQSAKDMTAVDDLKSYQKIVKTHEDALQRLVPAFQTLYDSMPDAQKKTADQVFRGSISRAARRG
ncbi:MAG: Spy/CpxP family protein refolding chaperone [Alphaproteobacteria bacterium]|nr:Spy/CpxP family protein refolding chaperone [Alphaproteobacteria bacterium]